MTVALSAAEIVTKLEAVLPGSIVESTGNTIVVKDEFLVQGSFFSEDYSGT